MAILQPLVTPPALQCKALPKRHSACKSLLKDGIGRCRCISVRQVHSMFLVRTPVQSSSTVPRVIAYTAA